MLQLRAAEPADTPAVRITTRLSMSRAQSSAGQAGLAGAGGPLSPLPPASGVSPLAPPSAQQVRAGYPW